MDGSSVPEIPPDRDAEDVEQGQGDHADRAEKDPGSVEDQGEMADHGISLPDASPDERNLALDEASTSAVGESVSTERQVGSSGVSGQEPNVREAMDDHDRFFFVFYL
jgi:hypothetical protein